MNPDIYIAGTGAFLPNDPVPNDAIVDYLGIVDPRLDAVRRKVLKQNGIKSRYYAIDTQGKRTHTNTEMCAKAMISSLVNADVDISDVAFLSAGTTLGDVLVPSFAQQVHGYLGRHGMGSIPVMPIQGVCLASVNSLATASAFIRSGQCKNALVGAGERASIILQSSHFSEEFMHQRQLAETHDGYSYFEAEFLRYMLSDGAAAAFVTTEHPQDYGFRIDWIRTKSYANLTDTCMFMGDLEPDRYDPSSSWLAKNSISDAIKSGLLNLRQKTTALKQNVVPYGVTFMKELLDEGLLDLDEIECIAAHISSKFFLNEIEKAFIENDIQYPMTRFFTNLEEYGNIGSGSFFLLLHHLLEQKRLKKGQKALFFVPESARFSYGYMQVTAV